MDDETMSPKAAALAGIRDMAKARLKERMLAKAKPHGVTIAIMAGKPEEAPEAGADLADEDLRALLEEQEQGV